MTTHVYVIVHPSMQKIISLHREKSAQNPCISLVVVVVTDSPPLETLQTFDQIDIKTTIQKDKKTKTLACEYDVSCSER